MASVRVSLRREAQRLADRYDDVEAATDGGLVVPGPAIDRLHRLARHGDDMTATLRWAWRSQHATYVDTATRADGLAAIMLLVALLHADDPRHQA